MGGIGAVAAVGRSARKAALVSSALLVAACSAGRVPAESVAAEAAAVLAERTGVRSAVDCSGELEAVTGTELRCVLTPEGERERYGLTVRVTSVDGDEVAVDVEVDDLPIAEPEDAPTG